MPIVSNLGAALITPDPVDPDDAYYNGGIAHTAEGAMYVVGGAGNQIPYVLAQSAIPYGIANSGTIATNGTVTLGTALNTTYSGGIWLYFPATAFASSAAGFYWTIMSSTTVGVVYTSQAATTPVTGSNAAYTGSTAPQDAVMVTIPAGAIGANGSFRLFAAASVNNTAGAKVLTALLGASTLISASGTTTTNIAATCLASNRNSQSSQRVSNYATTNASGTGAFLTIDTSSAKVVTFRLNIAVATDVLVLENYLIEMFPGS